MSSLITETLEITPTMRLRYRIARPDAPETGTVLLLQGRAECIELYGEVIAELTSRGFSVFTFDWRGQGLSTRLLPDPLKSYVSSFDDYLDDLDQFIHRIWKPEGRRRYLLTHSMGGHLALRYLAEQDFSVDGALLCAPMVGIQTRRWPKAIAPMVVGGMAHLGLADAYIPGGRPYRPAERRFPGNPLSGDPARFAVLPNLVRQDPALEVGGPTFGWVDAAFRSMAILTAESYAERIESPIGILVGDADVIIDLEAVRAIARRIRHCRFHLLEGARHEIMMENDALRAKFWQFFDTLAKDA